MKIEYFGYFCEVVESQGISVAAQKMYISQQGLSKALNVIESELGTTLLNRNRNSGSVSLTAEGQIFYDYASSIWKEYSRMCTVFQSFKGKQSGGEKVTICGTKFLLNNVLTPVFHTMTAAGKELPQILEKSIDEIFSGLDSQPSNQLNIVNIPEYTFSEIKRNSDLCFIALYARTSFSALLPAQRRSLFIRRSVSFVFITAAVRQKTVITKITELFENPTKTLAMSLTPRRTSITSASSPVTPNGSVLDIHRMLAIPRTPSAVMPSWLSSSDPGKR